jgi:hypothetical protein
LFACTTTEVDAPKPRPPKPEPIPEKPDEALLAFIVHNIELFKQDVGRWPATLDELRTKPREAENWRGPYLDGPAVDAWGRAVRYLFTATGYKVTSAGADGEFGTADDRTAP